MNAYRKCRGLGWTEPPPRHWPSVSGFLGLSPTFDPADEHSGWWHMTSVWIPVRLTGGLDGVCVLASSWPSASCCRCLGRRPGGGTLTALACTLTLSLSLSVSLLSSPAVSPLLPLPLVRFLSLPSLSFKELKYTHTKKKKNTFIQKKRNVIHTHNYRLLFNHKWWNLFISKMDRTYGPCIEWNKPIIERQVRGLICWILERWSGQAFAPMVKMLLSMHTSQAKELGPSPTSTSYPLPLHALQWEANNDDQTLGSLQPVWEVRMEFQAPSLL